MSFCFWAAEARCWRRRLMVCWRRWEGESGLGLLAFLLRWERGLLDGVGGCVLGVGDRVLAAVVVVN